jgi:pimeloyl-ACP methyl ester carboxylesterase
MFSGIRATAWRILNYATYYLMKERAGTVGTGLNSVLGRIRDKYPDLRIHLVGHSFGARLVTAAAAGPDLFAPSSMSLLQAAYSHNALGPGTPLDQVPEGFFRRIIVDERIRGPIIATHTQNDQAVGVAYAIASRLSGDVATDFGGPTDRFGGIGRNGAVRMGEGEVVGATLHDGHFDYGPWPAGKVTNLKADEFISCHGDVRNPAVANAVLNAARS